MTNFSAIADSVANAYEVTQTRVNLCVVVFFIAAVAFTFFTVPVIEKNMAMTLRVGALLTIVGAWSRYLVSGFNGILYSQIIIAVQQPFLYSCMAKISTIWFPDH
jgi:hypothetical protein